MEATEEIQSSSDSTIIVKEFRVTSESDERSLNNGDNINNIHWNHSDDSELGNNYMNATNVIPRNIISARQDERNENDNISTISYIRQAYINRRGIAAALCNIAFYASYISWFAFAIFIIGRFVQFNTIEFAGICISMVAVFLSISCDEISRFLIKRGRGVIGVLLIIAAVLLISCGIYGIAINNFEYTSGGVIGLFFLSFVPFILDSASFGIVETNDGTHSTYHHRTSSGGYNVIGEMFGIPQPQDPPPIEISRDKNLEDDWAHYLSEVNVEIPDDIMVGTVVDISQSKDKCEALDEVMSHDMQSDISNNEEN